MHLGDGNMVDKKAAFWITTTLLVCLFAVFVMLAVFITPDMDGGEFESKDVELVVENMRQMVWWMTVGLVVLPIMLLLLSVAVYLFITSDGMKSKTGLTPEPSASNLPASSSTSSSRPSLLGSPKPSPGAPPSSSKLAEATNPGDVLDLRYARGEITRDKYMEMKKDIKTPRL